jgi:hypothetical protein
MAALGDGGRWHRTAAGLCRVPLTGIGNSVRAQAGLTRSKCANPQRFV